MARPKKKPKDKMVSLRVSVPPDVDQQLSALAEDRNAPKSLLVREAIDIALELWLGVPASQLLDFTGPPEVVELKNRAVELYGQHHGPATIARMLGITRRTLTAWLRDDPNFEDLCIEASERSVETVAQALWVKATKDGYVNAMFGILNAKHQDFGLVRSNYISQENEKFLRTVIVPALRRICSRDQLVAFAEECRRALPGSTTLRIGPGDS